MAQMQSKAGFDSRSRDIRRRVDVIQKKLADLQELGIPCAFCYSSVRNTGSLFTLGDKRITDVIERHKNEILRNLIDESFEQPDPVTKEIHLILPPLPNTLDQLSRHTMQSLVIGILKDLGVKWSDPKPAWWPLEIPFVPPRSVPENFTGNWTQALKKVIESVYSYFSYDVDTYVAGNLDCSLEEGESESSTSDIESKVNEKQPYQASSTHAAGVSPKKQPNRVSSFTVENILNSTNSAGISNSSHSPHPASDESTPALQTTYSWPSVKYTKFTMLSPASMKNGSKNRSGNGSSWVQNTEFSSNVIKNESRRPSRTATSPPSSMLTSVISGEGGTTPHPVVPPSEPPTRQDRSGTLGNSEYHFPPSHRYIVLLPPNSKPVGIGAQSSGEVDSPAPTIQSRSPPAVQSSDCTPTPTQPALSPSMPHIYSSQVATEQGYRPIAPKTEAMKMAEAQALKNQNAESSSKKSKISKQALSKHPRLRFHMTTVVKKAKRRNATTSMTAPPPSLCSPNGSSSSAGRQTLGAGESFRPIAPKAHTITTSPNRHSISTSEHSADQSDTTRPVSSAEQEPSSQADVSVPQTSVLKDSGFHLQLVKQTLSNPSNAGARSGQRSRRGSSRGRGARGYTKRKRGLTFHLYEDPATAFRAKRTRQH